MQKGASRGTQGNKGKCLCRGVTTNKSAPLEVVGDKDLVRSSMKIQNRMEQQDRPVHRLRSPPECSDIEE